MLCLKLRNCTGGIGGGVGHGLAGVGGGIPWVPELHPPNPYPDRLTTHDRNQRY